MPLLFLWALLLFSSSCLYAQSPTTTTQDQMRALGFEPVDLSALRQTQTAAEAVPTTPVAPTPIPPAQELREWQQRLPGLERRLADSLADATADPALQQKHQVALDRARARIRVLEQQLAPSSTTPH